MPDRDAVGALIYLVSCAVNGETPDAGRAAEMDLTEVYRESERHMLTALAAAALADAGVQNASFREAYAKAVRKSALLNGELEALEAELEAAGIWYLPLKGAVLQYDYPRYGLRQMSDIDVLIDPARAEDVRAIMLRRGFTVESFGRDFHDVYHKPPVCSFEIHTALFSPVFTPAIRDYYARIEEKLLPVPGRSFGRRLRDEDLYLYLLAHEFKHHSMGGTGLRSLLDVYVFFRRHGAALDRGYIDAELGRLGLTEFEAQNRSLALDLFSGQALDAKGASLLAQFAEAGVYGRETTKISRAVARRGALRYTLSRVFLPEFYVKKAYPWFYSHKAALPLLPLYRLWLGLTSRRGKMKTELRTVLRSVREKNTSDK